MLDHRYLLRFWSIYSTVQDLKARTFLFWADLTCLDTGVLIREYGIQSTPALSQHLPHWLGAKEIGAESSNAPYDNSPIVWFSVSWPISGSRYPDLYLVVITWPISGSLYSGLCSTDTVIESDNESTLTESHSDASSTDSGDDASSELADLHASYAPDSADAAGIIPSVLSERRGSNTVITVTLQPGIYCYSFYLQCCYYRYRDHFYSICCHWFLLSLLSLLLP